MPFPAQPKYARICSVLTCSQKVEQLLRVLNSSKFQKDLRDPEISLGIQIYVPNT
jgi:hypothetical protein